MATRQADQSVPDEQFIGFMAIQGRNGSDSSFLIPERQCLEALNVDFYRAGLGRRRGGAIDIVSGFKAVAMYCHVPGDDQTLAEWWAMTDGGVLKRYTGGAWTTPTMKDACTATPQETVFQSFNGKLFIAYKNAHNRLHVWDPADGSVRRVGLDLPAAPTSGAPFGGAVTATRAYRVSWAKQSGGVTIKRSNLGPASAPVALVAQQVTLTRPAPPGEDETHWELWEAQDANFTDYRLLGTTAIGTATFTDNQNTQPSTVSPADGTNTPPPSCRYIVADDARLILAGAYETTAENAATPKNNRIWWTVTLTDPVIPGPDECVAITGVATTPGGTALNNYADVEQALTGLSQPLQLVSAAANSLERGSFYAFSYEGQWKFVSTGTSTSPYLRFRVTGGRGAIHHKGIVVAEDANGNPSIYWQTTTGTFRISVSGQEWCGEDNIDVWANINLNATIPTHAIFYPDLNQIWVYIATGSSSYPDTKLVFHTRLGRSTSDTGVRMGWTKHTGESCKAYSSVMFAETLGATVGRKLKPYVGYSQTAGSIWRCDTTDQDDNGVPFQAYIDSRSYAPWGLGRKGGMTTDAVLVATPSKGQSVQLTTYRNEGETSIVARADLTAHSDSGDETHVFPLFEGSALADSWSLRVRVGDDTARRSTWTLDGVIIPVTYQGER